MPKNTNLAYDLSKFEQPAERQVKKPQIKAVPKTKAQAQLNPVKVVLCLLVVVAVTAAMIYSRVVLTETGDQINAYNKELQVLQSENIRIQTELDSKMSLKNIEQYSTEVLGLAKLDPGQVEYLNLADGNKAEVTKPADEGALSKIKDFFSGILEYFTK